jgi:transposase
MKRQSISTEEDQEIMAAEKATQDKHISRKLRAIMLRYEGLNNEEAGKRLGLSGVRVSQLVSEYKKNGLEKFSQKKYGGNHRNMSEAEEEEILSRFRDQAESGQVIIARDIKRAFDEKLGRDTGRGYIYMLLARHEWRKTMPRSRHPKKADEEAIEASKKLNP